MAEAREQAWEAVLDDLESRLSAAERGDLDALSGWTIPRHAGPATSSDRGTRILARQQALLARLREQQCRTAAAIVALRGPKRRPFPAPAVYVDRAL